MTKNIKNSKIPEPIVLPRSEHCLSRKDFDPDALKVLSRLHRHGYKAYLVGGGVRDLLLNKQPKDFDISTDARPMQIKKLFNNCRIIGRRFRLAHILFGGNKIIEVSTFRKHPSDSLPADEKGPGAPKRGDNTFGKPHEDAMRRDLTINGLFYDISTFSIIDFVGGIKDLKAGIIRTIGDPDEKFIEDPIRMIRAVRHSLRTGLKIEEKTYAAIIKNASLLTTSNPSRLRDELQKDLDGLLFGSLLKLHKEMGFITAYFQELDDYLSISISAPNTLFQPLWIWNALSYLDSYSKDKDVIRDLRLLSLLFPLLEDQVLKRYPTIQESLHNSFFVQQILRTYSTVFGIPRRNLERVKILWIGWNRLLNFILIDKIPIRFQNKPYFDIILQWHRFHQMIEGCPEEDVEVKIQRAIQAGIAASRKKRSRKRKKRAPSNKNQQNLT